MHRKSLVWLAGVLAACAIMLPSAPNARALAYDNPYTPYRPAPPPSYPPKCADCSYANTKCDYCPKGYKCAVSKPKDCTTCPVARCEIDRPDGDNGGGNNYPGTCIKCTKQMPTCKSCGYDEECVVTPQTCSACATAVCKKKPKPPVPECVKCAQVEPTCKSCGYDEKCVVKPQTCSQCATAVCEKKPTPPSPPPPPPPPKCVVCPAVVPQCKPCAYDEKCVTTQQTCNACATATCQRNPGGYPPSTPPPYGSTCVQCLIGDPPCPTCGKGYKCEKKPATCTECATATCVRDPAVYY